MTFIGSILYQRLLEYQCPAILHEQLMHMIQRHAINPEATEVLLSLAVRLTFDDVRNEQTLDVFVLNILSIPFLSDYLTPNTTRAMRWVAQSGALMNYLANQHVMDKLCEQLASKSVFLNGYLYNGVTCFVANLVSLTTSTQQLEADRLTLLMSVFGVALDHLEVLNMQPSTSKADDDDDDMDVTELSAAQMTTKLFDPRLAQSLAPLHSKQWLQSVIATLTADNVNQACALLWKTTQVLPSAKMQILIQLTVNNTTANTDKLIWQAVSRSALYAKSVQSKAIHVHLLWDAKYSTTWPALMLLCEILSQQLLTCSDDEFLNQANMLSASEWEALAGLLRNVVFALLSNAYDARQSQRLVGRLTTASALKPMIVLVRQIWIRDSRLEFLPKDFWDMTSITSLEPFMLLPSLEQDAEEEVPVPQEQLPYRRILEHIPFVIPFDSRIRIFRAYIAQDKLVSHVDDGFRGVGGHRMQIRRDRVFEDGFEQLNGLGKELKHRLAISFIDQFGIPEAGIDGGGVFKEFLTQLSLQAFDLNLGLFARTSDQLIYPNPHNYAKSAQQLEAFAFLGRILGKALYEGVLVDVTFAGFFLSKWLSRSNFLDDLPSLDPELYKNLLFLKNYTGNVEDLALSFSLSLDEFGQSKTVELVPNGKELAVTNDNRIRYIYLVANYKLNVQIARQCAAFFSGLSDLINPRWLQMFDPRELQMLISGSEKPIDVADMQAHTVYAGDYHEKHPVIRRFWRVVHAFDSGERKALIKFATSCTRPPLLGFKELNPPLCIRHAGDDTERLPTSSTCLNLLKLPPYADDQTMRDKLLYSIFSGAGFDLS
ncbi:ubiquitin-protein ligase (E3) [Sorochytrium milnesiophthora]